MQKLKFAAFSFFCCCAREDDNTPQPTVNLESKRSNNIKYEEENNKTSLRLEVFF